MTLEALRALLWGWPLMGLLLFTGAMMTVRLRGRHLRALGLAFRYACTEEPDAGGEISAFGALCTALSATIGTGNIVGVATAIRAGGPGALFWMLLAALLGMATKYAEGLLAVKYRRRAADGSYIGGPFYYILYGLGRRFRPLAKLFAACGVIAGLLGIGTVTQAHSIVSAVGSFVGSGRMLVIFGRGVPLTQAMTGIAVTVFAAVIIFGGAGKIAHSSEVFVPFMVGTYILLSLLICYTHRQKLLPALRSIVVAAFRPRAVCGAASGITCKLAIRYGVGRGMFSNEAGLGTAPIAAAAAKTREPARQGLVCMLGTFIDTIVICTLTGLTVLVTDAWRFPALQGTAITDFAWRLGLPWSTEASSLLLTVCLCFFAFTTIVGWNFYAERCLAFLFPAQKLTAVFRVLYLLAVLVGPFLSVSSVWCLADICNALMAFPNLLSLLLLSGDAAAESARFFGSRIIPKLREYKKNRRRI